MQTPSRTVIEIAGVPLDAGSGWHVVVWPSHDVKAAGKAAEEH